MRNVMHITFASSLEDICEKNSSFDRGILRIAYTGKNRNGSYISKADFEKCLPTMFNCPIVCNYNAEDDTIGSHDVSVAVDEDGNMSIVNVTEPVGVVPESSVPYWETVGEDDGTVHEYLCVEVLLWKRQRAYKKIKRDGITSESMEITVKDGYIDKDTGFFVIKNFEFTAFCLLGDGIEPCFESASLEVFSNAGFKHQIEQMMCDLKQSFSVGSESMEEPSHVTEGGNALDEKVTKLFEEYGISKDDLDFSIDGLSVDELREKFEAMKTTDKNNGDGAVAPEENRVYELNSNIISGLIDALEAEKVESWWGLSPRYHYTDHDAETGEVYAFEEPDWTLCGFSYSVDGDKVVVDFASKKRMKFAIVPFVDGTQVNPFAEVFAKASEKYDADSKEWSEKFQKVSDELDAAKAELTELDELRKFKKAADDEKAKAEREQIFSNFPDLVGVEAFDNLKENCDGIALDALEEKCFAIRGRNGTNLNFAHKEQTTKIAVERGAEPEKEPYGGLVAKYCNL